MNSYRDNVKDIIADKLDKLGELEIGLEEYPAEIADDIFEALRITEDEQDKTGGYFLLHGGVKADAGEADTGEFSSTMTTSIQKSEDRTMIPMTTEEFLIHKARTNQLEQGAKYTSAEFKAFAKAKKGEETGGWHITLETPVCKYGQVYDKDMVLDEAKTRFANFYYNRYLDDYEEYGRSQELAEMDKE